MPDKIQSFKVVCEGGLHAGENHLDLAENISGAATRLVNYEVSLYGGYRRINGFEYLDDTNPIVAPGNAEGKVLCVAIFKDDFTNETYIIAARKDIGQNSYSFYRLVRFVGWEKMVFPIGMVRQMTKPGLSVKRIRFDLANFGDGNKIVFVDGVNPAIVWDGQNWREVTVAGTGTATSPGGNQCLDNPSLIGIFKGSVFIGGDVFSEATMAYSAPNNPFDFTAANGAGQLSIGFDVVQFKPFRDSLFVFGGNAIKKISPDLSATWLLDSVTANVGCIAPDSVVEIGGDLVFLAPDGLRPVAGTSRIGDVELETISRPIQPLLAFLPTDFDLDLLTGVVVRTKSQLRYFIGDDSIRTEDSYGIIGGLRTSQGQTGWEFGELQGIRASCATSGFVGREEYILHGDYDGGVYREERGYSFNGLDIVSVYATPYLDFGDTEVRKSIRNVNTFIKAEGPFTMNMSVAYDWDDIKTARPTSYSQTSSGAPVRYNGRAIRYNGINVRYGGTEKPIITTAIQGSGYATRLTYVNVGQDASYSIQGIVFEFSVAGRR